MGATTLPGDETSAPNPPETTRQIQLRKSVKDGRYSWRLARVPVPAVGDRQVLLRVHAVAIQRGDVEVSEMMADVFGIVDDRTGQVGGADAAGFVVQVGRRVESVRVGQKVVTQFFPHYVDRPLDATMLEKALGWTIDGVFGDYVVIDETGVVPKPDYLGFEEAATLPSSAITAWTATGRGNHLGSADTVVVQGTGGVAAFAIQFAIAQGARVIVTSSSEVKLQRMQAAGAHHGINYRQVPEWSTRVLELTGGRGADLVLDMRGRATIDQSMMSVAYEGTVALVGGLGGYDASLSTFALIGKGVTARGVMAGSRSDFARMCEFMRRHQIHPLIDKVYAFEDFTTAMSDLEAGHFVGKLVLRLREDP